VECRINLRNCEGEKTGVRETLGTQFLESEMRARDIWGDEKEETKRPTALNLDLIEEK
jgi:hypothetical protein